MKTQKTALIAGFIAAMFVSGCQTERMTLKSKLEKWEPVTVTNITMTATGGTTNITLMSAAAADLDIKKDERQGRTEVGKEKWKAKGRKWGGLFDWFFTPAPRNSSGSFTVQGQIDPRTGAIVYGHLPP